MSKSHPCRKPDPNYGVPLKHLLAWKYPFIVYPLDAGQFLAVMPDFGGYSVSAVGDNHMDTIVKLFKKKDTQIKYLYKHCFPVPDPTYYHPQRLARL